MGFNSNLKTGTKTGGRSSAFPYPPFCNLSNTFDRPGNRRKTGALIERKKISVADAQEERNSFEGSLRCLMVYRKKSWSYEYEFWTMRRGLN